MRPRGVVTLVALAAVLTFLFGSLAGRVLGVAADAAAATRDKAPAPAQADVAAPPPAAPVPPPVPEEILRHLPVTRDVLSGTTVVASLGDDERARDEEPLFELLPSPPSALGIASPLRVEYTLDPRLERRVFDVLESRGVALANVVVMDPQTGRLLAYVSTDTDRFSPSRTYPAASLIKIVTAAVALHHARDRAEQPCRFLGSPYTLTPARVNPPRRGQTVTLERALATSNNQCFAQLAVHALGTEAMVDAIRRFGFLREPAPGHAAGTIDPGAGVYDLGKLGCGLAGCWITPLHAAQLGGSLADGRVVQPWWIERVTDAQGRELALPPRRKPRQVMTPALAAELRTMLVQTTETGTARRGFHDRAGNPRLGSIQVSGKTGSLSGTDPAGRYEWFAGVAPADAPTVAIAVVVVQQGRVWLHASHLAGEVLHTLLCERGGCYGGAAVRTTSASSEPSKTVRAKRHVRRGKSSRARGG